MRIGLCIAMFLAGQTSDRPDASRPDWSGTFVVHADAGPELELVLQRDGRFDYRLTDVPGRPRALTGRWSTDAGVILLSPDRPRDDSPFPDMVTRWIGVPWEQRRYLVPEGRVVEFCNAVNLGFEPRRDVRGGFPLADGDWQRPAPSRPVLPPEWREYLLDEPLTGTLTEWLGEGYVRMWIRDADRLRGGMRFLLYDARRDAPRQTSVKVLCPCEGHAKVLAVEDLRAEVAWRVRPTASAGPDNAAVEESDAAGDLASSHPGDLELGDIGTTSAIGPPSSMPPDIVFAGEMKPWPAGFSRPAPAWPAPHSERLALEWQAAAARLEQVVDGAALAGISRWAQEQTSGAELPAGWAMALALAPALTHEDGRRVLVTHEVSVGPALPAHVDIVQRHVVVAAVYNIKTSILETVFVTIRGWAEE